MIPSETFKSIRVKLLCKSLRRQGAVKIAKFEVVYHSNEEGAGRGRTDSFDVGPMVIIHVKQRDGGPYAFEPGEHYYHDITKAPK